MTSARVILWGRDIAAVSWDDQTATGVFQYAPEFLPSEIQVAPLTMPLREGTFNFPALNRRTFKGLPGLLADSLPDKFGNALINEWLVRQGRTVESFNPVERLCYVGSRGIGALEFLPTIDGAPDRDSQLEIDQLVELANRIVASRAEMGGRLFGDEQDAAAIQNILRVGTSAGGARAKAVLSWNEDTGEFRSGQLPSEAGFTNWIMKFDGITNNADKEVADPQGYGLIEFAYHLMAIDAGITMTRCRLHAEGGRSHFMTQRFDRTLDGNKLHMQSLCAMCHYDFNQAGAHSYEQAIETCRRLDLRQGDIEQTFRRAIFNVIARNQDDHVKNIAFLMDKSGQWALSPAFDVVWSYNPTGDWTGRHQMTLQGKRDNFELADLLGLADFADIKTRRARSIISDVRDVVSRWPDYAATAGVSTERIRMIGNTHRLEPGQSS